ncbi:MULTISPECIES: hypothetical protein [unclassified Crossiella]|uniref:hypothetical protein n=1 Tax=unclassified Crossiella TaxID=2620835 RepID=UPI001FFE380D|nr:MULTISPECIES: hypothetical protein [unclassified Crossiella]MCK2244936.1 hypothetical protein [Crossiella sp. S99.2]MCK2258511.1 hypothetical protein [Crossiella sp. S99.1]
MRNSLALITITGALLLAGSPAQAAPVITDLGALPGYHLSWANDIGPDGVVGASSTPGQVQGVFWPNDGVAVQLRPAAAGWATAEAINNSRVIVGTSGDQAVRWAHPGAAPVLLPSPAVYTRTTAKSINNKGLIAGNGDHPETYQTRALRWSSGRAPRVLPPLPGHQESEVGSAGAVGENSVVVGKSDDDAVFWDAAGNVHKLPQLAGWARSTAHAINRHGVIVGSYDLPGGGGGAVRWERGRVTVLPNLPGADHSGAYSINDSGVSVGASSGRAVRWDAAGVATELPKLSDQLPGHAKAINERGQVTGTNSPQWRQDHAVRWTP